MVMQAWLDRLSTTRVLIKSKPSKQSLQLRALQSTNRIKHSSHSLVLASQHISDPLSERPLGAVVVALLIHG